MADQGRLRFGILGPLTVERDGEPVALPQSSVLRGLLGVLLAAQGEPVPADRLARLVWTGAPGDVRPGSVHVGVSRLRRWLGTIADDVTVERDTRGYRLLVDPAAVDLAGFRDLVARPGGDRERYESLRAAMRLRRGTVLADLPDLAFDDPLLRRIQDEVRDAGLALADLAVSAGHAQDALDWLEEHLHQEPWDEPAHARLITVLAAGGRPAVAFARYDQLRRHLADELGVSPSDEVQQAFRALLAGDRGEPETALPAAPPQPGLLPPDVADFTGRDEQVRHMLDYFANADPPPTAVKIVYTSGRAGIGKTALATHVGHRLRPAYPDGQLYADLHGFDARPAEPAEVLARFLRALGFDGSAVPPGLEERAELYRDALAQRRVLVVLDNAASEGQVRPLLPGSASCAVLVTSRRRLTGLSARSVPLDVLDHRAARDLLARIVGPERVAADPTGADEIVQLCGYLPLAIRIVGGRLARLPHRDLRWLADRLADDRHRLNELRLEDLEVRASLELSFRTLSAPAQRLFAYLGALDAPDLPSWVAAELMDAADQYVDELVDGHLLDVVSGPRYYMHDLVRIYAREREPTNGRRPAVLRALTGWYLRAGEADRRLRHRFPRPAAGEPVPIGETVPVEDPLTWFETERLALTAAVHQAYELEADDLSWDLASRLTGFFETRGYYDDWLSTHQIALRAARRAGASAGEAVILHRLGEMHANRDDYHQALEYFDQARLLFHGLGDRLAEAHVLRSTGVAQRMVGQMDDARHSLETALAMFVEHDDRTGIADAQHGLGAIHREQGRFAAAATSYRQALALFEASGDEFTQSLVLISLGIVWKLTGRAADAESCFLRSLERSRAVGNRAGEGYALSYLGELKIEQGQLDLAGALLDAARAIFEDIGERFGLALAWRAIGTLHSAAGDLASGVDGLTQALAIFTELDLPLWRARVLEALGDVRAQEGRPAEASEHWRLALELFRELRAPEADRLAGRVESGR